MKRQNIIKKIATLAALLFIAPSVSNAQIKEFNEWLKNEGLQVIATRVSTGDECSIIIEDGYAGAPVSPAVADDEPVTASKAWKKGEF